ncbi:unnamed protein product [Symbiodinium sp. KB8]|nr:unnamed protein product [Symbiodinium sp. KB8]
MRFVCCCWRACPKMNVPVFGSRTANRSGGPLNTVSAFWDDEFEDVVTGAGHQLLPPLLLSSVASPVGPDSTAVMNAVCAAAQAAASAAAAAAAVLPVAAAGSFPLAPADTAEGPRTPPRQRPGKVDRDSKSPTILSLASALTSAQTPPPVEPRKRAPSRLNIAAHLLEAPSKPSALPQLRADAPSFVPGAEVC